MNNKPDQIPDANKNDNRKKDAWTQGHKDLGDYLQSRLHYNLERELLKANKETWAEVYEITLELEIIQQNNVMLKKAATLATSETINQTEVEDD